MPQIHVDFPVLQLQFHTLYAPRSRDSQNLLIQLRVLHGVSFNPPKHHGNCLTSSYQMSKMTIARRNGVGLCWEATRQGISELRMCQRHQCPGSPRSQGTPVSFLRSLWTSELCLKKSRGLGQSPSYAHNSIHPKAGIPHFPVPYFSVRVPSLIPEGSRPRIALHPSSLIPHPSPFPPVANRDNHYEAAFEEYLRSRGVPYVAVDEAKRSVLSDGASIKSLDFMGSFCRKSLLET